MRGPPLRKNITPPSATPNAKVTECSPYTPPALCKPVQTHTRGLPSAARLSSPASASISDPIHPPSPPCRGNSAVQTETPAPGKRSTRWKCSDRNRCSHAACDSRSGDPELLLRHGLEKRCRPGAEVPVLVPFSFPRIVTVFPFLHSWIRSSPLKLHFSRQTPPLQVSAATRGKYLTCHAQTAIMETHWSTISQESFCDQKSRETRQ